MKFIKLDIYYGKENIQAVPGEGYTLYLLLLDHNILVIKKKLGKISARYYVLEVKYWHSESL